MTTTPQKIEPQKVTKPIQLLAAWLVGLILVDGAFLAAAIQMGADGWERSALIVAAIVNVPLFLFALFLLQTKFRPELQEDVYYSQYLDKKTNTLVTLGRDEAIEKEVTGIRAELSLLASEMARRSALPDGSKAAKTVLFRWRIGLNKHLSDFAELRATLKEQAIPLSDVFGADTPPGKRHVAIDRRIDFQSKVIVLNLACEMKMDAYTYFDPQMEGTNEQILIGSYGSAPYPITPALRDLLQSKPDEVDLQVYEVEHKRDS
ncbi:MAG: hypothetical protein IH988_00830 [Planctomycetes bacterium]|nr:hypothetical protein [Planctomycetota bacterium]